MGKIIHVHLNGKRRDYYFSSIAAIFTVLSPQDIGYKPSYLYHSEISGGGALANSKCIIKQSKVIRKKQG